MRSSSFLAPLFFAATAVSQAVPEGIAPSSSPPSGCETTANGNFTIGTLKLAHSKRESATAATDGALFCNLNKGVLRDSYGRTGAVVANRQFQFDGPPQAGSIYTGGFSICKNGSLAIGGTTRWWQCSSGDFHNLYDQWIGAQCEEIRIQAQLLNQPTASPSAASSSLATPVVSIVSSLATISGQISTVSASAVGPTASASRNGTASVTSSAQSSGASASAGASSSTRGLTPGSSAAAGASSAAPAPPANGAASRDFAASSALGLVLAVLACVF